jgi:predicted GTPase
VDPRPFAAGRIKSTFEIYPETGKLLPAMGYGKEQMADLGKTIHNTDCDTVIIGTPIDLSRIIRIDKPAVRVGYDLQEIGKPDLDEVISGFLKDNGLA